MSGTNAHLALATAYFLRPMVAPSIRCDGIRLAYITNSEVPVAINR